MLVLTLLTGAALLVLLIFLGWALSRIARALQGITDSLEKICMGVRAIETETTPLVAGVTTLNETFGGIADGFASVEATLSHAVHAREHHGE